LQFHLTVSEFIAIAQPARYITTAQSPLCCETISLRGRGEGGWLCFRCLEVPARCEPLAGSGHSDMPTGFQIERCKSALARISWSRRCFPRFPLCVVTSPGPSDRIRRVGRFWCLPESVSAGLNLVGADRRPDAVKAFHGRTPGPRSWPSTDPPRTPGIDKNAWLRVWHASKTASEKF
jgi:hypothetical protein